MGHDPKTSLLNKWNQLHACKNVFCHGRCVHDVDLDAKSFAHLHGDIRESRGLCGQIFGLSEVCLRRNP